MAASLQSCVAAVVLSLGLQGVSSTQQYSAQISQQFQQQASVADEAPSDAAALLQHGTASLSMKDVLGLVDSVHSLERQLNEAHTHEKQVSYQLNEARTHEKQLSHQLNEAHAHEKQVSDKLNQQLNEAHTHEEQLSDQLYQAHAHEKQLSDMAATTQYRSSSVDTSARKLAQLAQRSVMQAKKSMNHEKAAVGEMTKRLATAENEKWRMRQQLVQIKEAMTRLQNIADSAQQKEQAALKAESLAEQKAALEAEAHDRDAFSAEKAEDATISRQHVPGSLEQRLPVSQFVQ